VQLHVQLLPVVQLVDGIRSAAAGMG
jgi:hypothetical protein